MYGGLQITFSQFDDMAATILSRRPGVVSIYADHDEKEQMYPSQLLRTALLPATVLHVKLHVSRC